MRVLRANLLCHWTHRCVWGAYSDFQEASSRNTGLIETAAVGSFAGAFAGDHCLVRLERYVVPVTFVDKEDKNTSDVSRLLTDPGRARVAAALAKVVMHTKNVELLEYSKRLVGILSERLPPNSRLRLLALGRLRRRPKTGTLFQKIPGGLKLCPRNCGHRRRLRASRLTKNEGRKQSLRQERRRLSEWSRRGTEQLTEEKKRSLFLTSIASFWHADTIITPHYQATIHAVDIQQQIENFLVKISGTESVARNDVINTLESIALLNRKVMGIFQKFATKANFRRNWRRLTRILGNISSNI